MDIPETLNGYRIIAHAPTFTLDGELIKDCKVILCHDPSRRLPKYATAMISGGSLAHREWFWGHYYEGDDALIRATRDFVHRMGILPPPRLECGHESYGQTHHCANITCLNYIERHRTIDAEA